MVAFNSKLGFLEVGVWDKVDQNILLAYCEGHSFLWNMFFGWRKTIVDSKSKYTFMYFLIPSKNYEILKKLIAEIRKNH